MATNKPVSPAAKVVAIVIIVLVVGSLIIGSLNKKSSNGSTSAPSGVDQAIWDDYCGHGASLADYLHQYSNGTLTAVEFADKLKGSEDGIAGDASATGGVIGSGFQRLADAIGRAHVALLSGLIPDYGEITTAAEALPTCSSS